jgi:2'-deoxymugineic-acid 2'-dioxygenase/mugineic-acid 3-dioxygenase
MELLRLLCHGMGLRPGYFEGDISGGDLVLRVNHYPPCPDPSAALGLPPHRDRNLITLLLPGMVEPVPNALVVNFGKQLEVGYQLSNRSIVSWLSSSQIVRSSPEVNDDATSCLH